jgi:hypothetical protein
VLLQNHSLTILSINNIIKHPNIRSNRLARSTCPLNNTNSNLIVSLYSSLALIPPHAWMTLTPSGSLNRTISTTTIIIIINITNITNIKLDHHQTRINPEINHPWNPPNQPTHPIKQPLTTLSIHPPPHQLLINPHFKLPHPVCHPTHPLHLQPAPAHVNLVQNVDNQ